jgi:hypothetical protein
MPVPLHAHRLTLRRDALCHFAPHCHIAVCCRHPAAAQGGGVRITLPSRRRQNDDRLASAKSHHRA